MKTTHCMRCLTLGIGLVLSAAVGAADFDGSEPLTCLVRNCKLSAGCVMTIDPPNKTVKAPYRTELLPIANSALNNEQLQLQGTAEKFAWSAVVNRQTGKVTITIAHRVGAYVLFGQCKERVDG
jgi:hypothetical protein